MSRMIRAVIVDDQALVRLGLTVLLENEDDITLVGEAADGREALDVVRRTRPDIVLMDVRMPVLDGIEALRIIAADAALAATKVLVLTTFELDEYVFEALRAGASGFMIKDTEPAELLRAIRVVASGEALLSPTVTRRLISEFVTGPARRAARTRTRSSARSPNGNARSSARSRWALRMTRSRPGWCSVRRRSVRTSAARW